eukprot:TRINITY_DN6635_c0_g1_i1.p1 TRINITY_DN6635_c0_g1~~TRINITY_DN6635_c0_g1_i1.p1  ORF type:complete len:191 (+),score=79.41 TRINITY_DN6635_c0_g1_i1:264-836(+)
MNKLIVLFLLGLAATAFVAHADEIQAADSEDYNDETGEELPGDDLEGGDGEFSEGDEGDFAEGEDDSNLFENEDLNLELGPEEKCEMCQHVYNELKENSDGLEKGDVLASVTNFCDGLDEEIADAVYDICQDFITQHGKPIGDLLVQETKPEATDACKQISVCTDEHIANIAKQEAQAFGGADENADHEA